MSAAEQAPVYLVGLCAGGPFDGMVLESPTPTVTVPILGFGAAKYEFNADAQIFVWRRPSMEEATR